MNRVQSDDCTGAGDICYLTLDEADISVSVEMAKESLQQMSTEPKAKLILMTATTFVPRIDSFIYNRSQARLAASYFTHLQSGRCGYRG